MSPPGRPKGASLRPQAEGTPVTLIDATHDPALQSWVEPANAAGTHWPCSPSTL